MRNISDSAWLVLACFPDQWESVINLIDHSSEFRTLCSDYADAVEASQCWRVSDTPEGRTLAKGYRSVAAELEVEIWHRLQNHAAVSS